MKLSNKQKMVLQILNEEKTYIIFMKGLVTRCFISGYISYNISTATMFALEKLKLIEEIKDDWNSSEYQLTELGKTIKF